MSTWMSENGLAWLGGGTLALGGLFLVAYAAQQGLFTPALRIWAAVAVGLAMLGAGELIRRRTAAPGGRHALAAAAASGAGAATLYAAVWAAYALYRFIALPPAAALLASISLGLLGLALVHGEALGLLAIAGAFLAPVVCNLPNWNGIALDGYLVVIVATGLAAASLRNWPSAALATLAASALWILSRGVNGDIQGAGGLLVATPAISLIAVMARLLPAGSAGRFELVDAPLVSLIGATLLWSASVGILHRPALAQALVGASLALLTAATIRQGLSRAWSLAVPATGLVAIALADATSMTLAPAGAAAVWLSVPIVALALAGLGLTLAQPRRPQAGVIGAAGAALALTLLRQQIALATPGFGGLAFILAACGFFAGAALISRRSAAPANDLPLAAWVGAGSEALGLAIHTSLGGLPEPTAYGALAAMLALAARRLPWRGLPEAAALAALVSLLCVFGPIARAALTGTVSWTDVALAGGGGALAQAVTWRALAGRANAEAATEATSTSAIISGLTTAFLILRVLAAPHANGGSLNGITEAALRTDLLIAAGYVLTLRGGGGVISRARGPVLLALGAAHGLLIVGLVLNPWWGAVTWYSHPPPVAGPPVIDEIALAYLVPALLLAAAASRLRGRSRRIAAALAVAAAGAVTTWAMTEIRRLFHGHLLGQGDFAYAEVAAYAVALLGIAWGETLPRGRTANTATLPGLAEAAAIFRWAALALSAWLLCVTASPWWGPLEGPFRSPLIWFPLMSAGIGLTAALARSPAVKAGPVMFGRAVRATAICEAFALLTVAIRFSFHGEAMRMPLREASIETWTYSAAWALFGLLTMALGARRNDRALRWLGLAVMLAATAKVFLFDMATLQGVVRAASFLALGSLLLAGALVARRLGAVASAGEAAPSADDAEGQPGA